jgi:hypothetical protein
MVIRISLDINEGEIGFSGPTFTDEFIAGKEIPNPKNAYVYGHYSSDGKLFYVGKGTGGRAWDLDRHPVWKFYLNKYLNGIYKVRIIQENLSDEEAELLEENIIDRYGDKLVNWVNFGRKTDFAALNNYHILRNTNKARIVSAKKIEKDNPNEAIRIYREVIDATMDYQSLDTESGLLGKLLKEMAVENGYKGEFEAINRLTMCLCKINRPDEAFNDAQNYFNRFRADIQLSRSKDVIKRVEKQTNKSLVLNTPLL